MVHYIDADRLRAFKEALADTIVSAQGLPTYEDCKERAEAETDVLLAALFPLQQDQPEVDDIEFRCGYFSGPIFPAWIDAPSTLQPAHKYHGLEVAACHLKGGGYRVVPRNEPVSFELPEGTHLVGGWKGKAPKD